MAWRPRRLFWSQTISQRNSEKDDDVRIQRCQVGGRPLDGGSTSIDGEFRAPDETRAIRREEDNSFGDLVGGGWTPRWRLGG